MGELEKNVRFILLGTRY